MATLANTLGQSGGLPLSRILVAGAAGGLVDMAYFSTRALIKGRNPIEVFGSIAHFWPTGGLEKGSALLTAIGGVTHFGLATIMAAGFVLLMPTLLSALRSVWLAGAAYGLILYAVMYWIVMPLRWPKLYPQFEGSSSVMDILVHVAVGLTFAAILARHRAGPSIV